MSPIRRLNESTLIKTSHRHNTSLWFQYYYNIIDITRRKVAGINKMITQQKMLWSFNKFSQLTFQRKCTEIGLENHGYPHHPAVALWMCKDCTVYTPISIKVDSEKNDAWSMFHSPHFIIVARLVNYVPARSLETKKANAADTSMLCQQKVKTMYFKTLNPRLVNLRQWFEVRFFSVVICKCCKFSTSLLGSCTWEFWMELKKIKFKVFVEPQ